jgi:hypothetical protein
MPQPLPAADIPAAPEPELSEAERDIQALAQVECDEILLGRRD